MTLSCIFLKYAILSKNFICKIRFRQNIKKLYAIRFLVVQEWQFLIKNKQRSYDYP